MTKRTKRLFMSVVIGIVVLAGGIWVLSRMLGRREALYQGKPVFHWIEQSKSSNPVASNEAIALFYSQIMPQLTNVMFNDTNDSKLRLALIDNLNTLPGIYVQFTPADGRRASAAGYLGEFGPPAKAAIPVLIQAAKGPDRFVRGGAILSLGKIHGEPEVVIPLLIGYLDDEDLNDEAAEALGNYGPLAKAAVPGLVKLLQAHNKDTWEAAREALQEIDPETCTNVVRDVLAKFARPSHPSAK